MTEQSVLVQKRGRVKGTLTRVKTYAESIQENIAIEDLTARLEKIEEAWVEFQEIEDSLLLFPGQTSELDEFEAKYFDTKSMLTRAIKERTPIQNPTSEHMSANLNGSINMTSNDQFNATMHSFLHSQQSFFENLNRTQPSSSNPVDLRLPRINIPNFSGDYKEWPAFQDLFETLVDKNESLNGCQKLQYLKGLLKGEASGVIRHLTVTEGNYVEAWAKLKARFNKKRHITTSMINTFMDQPAINQPSAKNLRNLYDSYDEVIRGLKALGADAQTRDPWLIFLALGKLDIETKQLWFKESSEKDFPSFEDLLNFLNKRCDALETCSSVTKRVNPTRVMHATSAIKRSTCLMCKDNHVLYSCPQFKSKSYSDRKSFVTSNSLCFNCLQSGHTVHTCRSKHRCFHCKRMHHSLLHEPGRFQPQSSYPSDNFRSSITGNTSTASPVCPNPSSADTALTNIQSNSSINPNLLPHNNQPNPTINTVQSAINNQSLCSLNSYSHTTNPASLLPTAIVNVMDVHGHYLPCRLLLDSGSQISFISESCVQRLALKRQHARLAISGLGATKSGYTRGQVVVSISPRFNNNPTLIVDAFIMSNLTSPIPSSSLHVDNWDHLKQLQIADPSFKETGPIDIIIGADKFFQVIKEGKIIGPNNQTLAQQTIFGWVLCGSCPHANPSAINLHSQPLVDLDRTLRRFWEIEEVVSQQEPLLTNEEIQCEEHFKSSFYRDKSGHYVVSLPFKHSEPQLGQSESNAIRRLYSIEKRFKRDPLYKEHYVKFMAEYHKLQHMEQIPTEELNVPERYFYLPHHAVFKTSPSTKIRVVFDGSCKSASGLSLNDNLMTGPTIQRDLVSILLSFRKHKVAFSADIEKMYRQVKVTKRDRDFQRIVWRENSSQPIKHYRLTTVTYGTSSAPFLATRTLKQIAIDNTHLFPEACSIIQNNFYVDDLLSGADSEAEAIRLQDELKAILRASGFNLTKWRSNFTSITSVDSAPTLTIHDSTEATKILGLQWDPQQDIFLFEVSLPSNETLTKRSLLSESSRLFDPLGWLAPIVVTMKILFQQLWLSNMQWDDPLPSTITQKWKKIKENLAAISKIKIPRLICHSYNDIYFHGFSDASELAYGAVIYCRTIDRNGLVCINLVTAKSKVAPLKQVSLPRLELCAALLLSRLMSSVIAALSFQNATIHAWSDSSVVLSWLSDIPKRWKTYVANRTSEILDTIPRSSWKYVPSADNPADIVSRGIPPEELPKCNLWWQGPPWLRKENAAWPHNPNANDSTAVKKEERKCTLIINHSEASQHMLHQLSSRCSSWTKLIHIFSYCLRFIHNVRQKEGKNRIQGLLKAHELQKSSSTIIKWAQSEAFVKEINQILAERSLPMKSPLINLHPFLDNDGVLRVGGRLQNSSLEFDTKHPRILPKENFIARLIVQEMHHRYLHPGVTVLISIIRQEFWIIKLRQLVKEITHKCIVCFRHRTSTTQQLMGSLPEHRVSISRPFLRLGVDYAGPIEISTKFGRSTRSSKAYIALFVCFSTKALHIELVSSLSSEAFLAAFRRFVARRGIPSDIYSDNGTNFVGANRIINELHELSLISYDNPLICNFLSQNNIKWHFIPPSAPHFGGLWEAGVKSVKSHLRRVIGETRLTFEEMTTLLAQIESILNSRPLCPLSNEIDSLDVLTPSHFLVGHALTSIPEPNLIEEKASHLGRWRHLQALMQGFWKRWSRDYLTSLQQRPKWKLLQASLKPNELVILSEPNTPPSKWVMGRIETVHPGKDGLVRVAVIRTERGLIKRAINRIHRLPLDKESS